MTDVSPSEIRTAVAVVLVLAAIGAGTLGAALVLSIWAVVS